MDSQKAVPGAAVWEAAQVSPQALMLLQAAPQRVALGGGILRGAEGDAAGAAAPLLHLPLSRLHPTGAPAGAPCTAQGASSAAIPFTQCLQLSHRRAGVISPRCFVVRFLIRFFYPF